MEEVFIDSLQDFPQEFHKWVLDGPGSSMSSITPVVDCMMSTDDYYPTTDYGEDSKAAVFDNNYDNIIGARLTEEQVLGPMRKVTLSDRRVFPKVEQQVDDEEDMLCQQLGIVPPSPASPSYSQQTDWSPRYSAPASPAESFGFAPSAYDDSVFYPQKPASVTGPCYVTLVPKAQDYFQQQQVSQQPHQQPQLSSPRGSISSESSSGDEGEETAWIHDNNKKRKGAVKRSAGCKVNVRSSQTKPAGGAAKSCGGSKTPSVGKAKITIWLARLLQSSEHNPRVLSWVDRAEGKFRVNDQHELARLWGVAKRNPKMNYEKFSRAMRYYYDRKELVIVRKKMVYQFGIRAAVMRAGCNASSAGC